MWAVESTHVDPSVESDVVYYRMAKEFGFPPEAVDRMSNERVQSLLFIDSEVAKKEARDAKSAAPEGRRY